MNLKNIRFEFFSFTVCLLSLGSTRVSAQPHLIPSAGKAGFITHIDPSMAAAFRVPPDSIQTSVYWYWISDNISREGVVKDLYAMKREGINRAFIGNIGIDETPSGKVKIFSDEWWEIVHATLKTATELHIEIGIFNSPGWSQSGGPWIKPQQAMRYLASSELDVTGPGLINKRLAAPVDSFADVRVLAFPAPKDYHTSLSSQNPVVTSEPAIAGIGQLMDGNPSTEVNFPAAAHLNIHFSVRQDFTVQSLIIYTAHRPMRLEGEIQAAGADGTFHTIRTFVADRTNPALNTGFYPYGPVAVSIPATTARDFRLVFNNTNTQEGIAEIFIRKDPVVENYIEKTLAKMHPVPLPYWKEYQWPAQPKIADSAEAVDPGSVLDISASMSADGTLNWQAPAGNWVILRTGMTPTRVVNSPATPEGRGLEVDKMSKLHIAEHFDAFLGEIQRRIPAEDRKTWKMVVEDSYETGGQNWTDGMIEKFRAAFGYDPMPYMPVFQGIVVGSQDRSDRFLWDLRRFIADRVSYDYVGGLREVSHQHGLKTWLECYGHWGFPGEFLQYGGQSDEVAGEFWSEGELGDIENRAASSCAHIYGKTKVSAESFTAGGKAYARIPADMKQRGDRFFTEGINNTLLHLYIEQPDEREPGVNAPFGNEFNRHNTWFEQLDLFTTYMKRCNLMLQKGRYVADVAYFIGEDAPKMTGVRDPEIPRGYSYDYINAEVIEQRLTIHNGRWTLPDGLSYAVLVLPKLKTMRPALLHRILDLVSQGGILLGPPPERSPSLQDYGNADKTVRQLARSGWGAANEGTAEQVKTEQRKIKHIYGSGLILDGYTTQEALDLVSVLPDFYTDPATPVLFIHRQSAWDGQTDSTGRSASREDIYFVSNQSDQPLTFTPAFRVQGKSPVLMDPVTGTIRPLPAYKQLDGVTTVPLVLAGLQSAFIIFNAPATEGAVAATVAAADHKPSPDSGSGPAMNFPAPRQVTEINTRWMVSFDPVKRGPAKPVVFEKLTDWAQRPEDSIRNYSGTAIYRNSFRAPAKIAGAHTLLDLGRVRAMAKVRVNGIYVGGVWTPPYSVDISSALRPGINKIEVEVVNTWVNRLIGDSKLPVEERKTWTSVNIYGPDSPYQSSGLLGPVVLKSVVY